MVFVPRRFEPALLIESPRATEPRQRLRLGKNRVMLTGWSGRLSCSSRSRLSFAACYRASDGLPHVRRRF